VSKKEFEKQMKYLSLQYEFVSLSEVAAHVRGKKTISNPAVAITFDDGYKNVLSVVPIMRKLKISPTMFVITHRGKENTSELQTKRDFLSVADLKTLLKNGWEIGSHTRTHPDMAQLNKKQIQDEVQGSKKELQHALKTQVSSIAFPKGKYNKFVLKSAKDAGYKMCLTMNDGIIDEHSDLLQLPRIGVDGTHSFSEFKVLSSALVVQLRQLLKKKNS